MLTERGDWPTKHRRPVLRYGVSPVGCRAVRSFGVCVWCARVCSPRLLNRRHHGVFGHFVAGINPRGRRRQRNVSGDAHRSYCDRDDRWVRARVSINGRTSVSPQPMDSDDTGGYCTSKIRNIRTESRFAAGRLTFYFTAYRNRRRRDFVFSGGRRQINVRETGTLFLGAMVSARFVELEKRRTVVGSDHGPLRPHHHLYDLPRARK